MNGPSTAARRRRASIDRKAEVIMGLARSLPLTRRVLAYSPADATPARMEFMDFWMRAGIESRELSKRTRLIRQAGFPASKELDGYDRTPVRLPVDTGANGSNRSASLGGTRTS